MTPCEEKGYKIGDRFKVLEDGPFSVGSIVELYVDDGSPSPKFKLISGHCEWDIADGPGAYTFLYSVEKIMTKEERIERMEKELAALKEEVVNERAEEFLKEQEWEPAGGGWIIQSEGEVVYGFSTARHNHFGVQRPTKELAEKARDAMRIHNRALAYVHEHAPDWDGCDPYRVYWSHVLGYHDVTRSTTTIIGTVTGPEHVMRKLATDLNSGRVKL